MTALFQRDPAEEIPRFHLNLDRVTLDQRSIDSAICCVQSFVRDPLFTQRDFFKDNGISMLLSAVNVAGSVCEDSMYDPWPVISPEVYAAVVADLKMAYDVVVVRRKEARDTCERWFGVDSVAFSAVGESSGLQGVQISNIVEVGRVEYLPQSVFAIQVPSTSFAVKSPGKGKQKKSEAPAKTAIKRRFEFHNESVVLPKGRGVYFDDPNFAIALHDDDKTFSSRRSGRSRRVRQSFSLVPDNFTYLLHFKLYLVIRVCSFLSIARCCFTELSSS